MKTGLPTDRPTGHRPREIDTLTDELSPRMPADEENDNDYCSADDQVEEVARNEIDRW